MASDIDYAIETVIRWLRDSEHDLWDCLCELDDSFCQSDDGYFWRHTEGRGDYEGRWSQEDGHEGYRWRKRFYSMLEKGNLTHIVYYVVSHPHPPRGNPTLREVALSRQLGTPIPEGSHSFSSEEIEAEQRRMVEQLNVRRNLENAKYFRHVRRLVDADFEVPAAEG